MRDFAIVYYYRKSSVDRLLRSVKERCTLKQCALILFSSPKSMGMQCAGIPRTLNTCGTGCNKTAEAMAVRLGRGKQFENCSK